MNTQEPKSVRVNPIGLLHHCYLCFNLELAFSQTMISGYSHHYSFFWRLLRWY